MGAPHRSPNNRRHTGNISLSCLQTFPPKNKRTHPSSLFPCCIYFKCKNSYSGNEYGLRYRLTPGKRTVPDPDGGEGAVKEESILTVDYWPDPWTLEKTDPALRRRKFFR